MTKEEFAALQLSHRESGKTLKEFLKYLGVGYSTYNYWRKKFLTEEEEPHELAPISFRESSHHQSSSAVFSGDLPSGATLLPDFDNAPPFSCTRVRENLFSGI